MTQEELEKQVLESVEEIAPLNKILDFTIIPANKLIIERIKQKLLT